MIVPMMNVRPVDVIVRHRKVRALVHMTQLLLEDSRETPEPGLILTMQERM